MTSHCPTSDCRGDRPNDFPVGGPCLGRLTVQPPDGGGSDTSTALAAGPEDWPRREPRGHLARVHGEKIEGRPWALTLHLGLWGRPGCGARCHSPWTPLGDAADASRSGEATCSDRFTLTPPPSANVEPGDGLPCALRHPSLPTHHAIRIWREVIRNCTPNAVAQARPSAKIQLTNVSLNMAVPVS